MRRHNKSLHPIWSLVPAFARRSLGAANAGPMAQTGELNRYAYTNKLNLSRGSQPHACDSNGH